MNTVWLVIAIFLTVIQCACIFGLAKIVFANLAPRRDHIRHTSQH